MYQGKVIVITGNGKGKTTSALGLGFKYWLEGKKVLFLQFIKGERQYGELKAAALMGDDFVIRQMGLGFVRNADEEALRLHRQYAANALEEALKEITSGKFDIIVLDEINYAVYFKLVTEEQVADLIKQKPPGLTLVLTGRYAGDKVLDDADEAYEFKEIKHPAAVEIMARQGIEY